MSFHVGMKVVCVDAGPSPAGLGNRWVKGEEVVEGAIYTIRSVHTHTYGPVVWLDEVRRSQRAIDLYGPKVGYDATRFRPLITRSTETGMAILRKVADDAAKRQNLIVNA